jgi:hypothetical protein
LVYHQKSLGKPFGVKGQSVPVWQWGWVCELSFHQGSPRLGHWTPAICPLHTSAKWQSQKSDAHHRGSLVHCKSLTKCILCTLNKIGNKIK